MKKLFLFLICFQALTAYVKSPFVDEGRWNMLAPFFLPEEHPIKPKLDKIFSDKTRVCLNLSTLDYAGFDIVALTKNNRLVVAKHKKLKGYLVKLHTDDQLNIDEGMEWFWRIEGAQIIDKAISRLGYQALFKVPKKWIYPLPSQDTVPEGFRRNHFILIVEDMKILSYHDNFALWKNPNVLTQDKLNALFTLIKEEGLYDSIYPDNVPFCKDGKLAFIDTQHYGKWPIRYHVPLKYMSPASQSYWNQLIQNNGPPPA